MCFYGNGVEDKMWYLLEIQDHSLQNCVELLPTSTTPRGWKTKYTDISTGIYSEFNNFSHICTRSLTAFAVHVGVALAGQHSMFVGDGI